MSMIRVLKNTLLIIFVMCIGVTWSFSQNISVIVSPHPDDWQLFMNPNAYNELAKPNRKVIFLHITAGDAGYSDTSYYKGREDGSLKAIRFMASTLYGSAGTNMNAQKININGHSIQRYSFHNAVSYFLKLPDGGNGPGYAIHNYKNLEKFYSGSITQISAIDGSTTYNSLTDFETTIEQLIKYESANPDSIQFNLADTETASNPGDHADHIYSSLIMQNVATKIAPVTINLYREYATGSDPQNIFGSDFLIDAATWGVTVSGLADNFCYHTWDAAHNSWVGKQYFRSIEISDSIDEPNPDAIAPSVPANFAASASSSTTVNASWSASTDNVGVAGYEVFSGSTSLGITTTTSMSITSLVCNTTYSLTVKARDAAGNVSAASSASSVTTNACLSVQTPYSGSAISLPGKLEVENYDKGGQNIAYYDSDGGNSGGQYRTLEGVDVETCTEGGYNVGWINGNEWLEYTVNVAAAGTYDIEVRYAGTSAGVAEIIFSNGSKTTGDIAIASTGGWQSWATKTITGIALIAGEQIMRINIKSGGYNLNFVNVKSVGAADTEAPSAPTALATSNVGQYSLTLTWTASADNIGVSGYHIYRNGVLLSTNSTTSYSDNSVTPGTTYSYSVKAYDAFGNESLFSQSVSVTTLASTGNLALNKPTTASSYEGSQYSSLAVDGINSTSSWWGANPYSQWWRVDLQNEYLLNKVVVVNYYDGYRYYRYDIQVSLDGATWSPLVDFNSNSTAATALGNSFIISNVKARYIRVNMNYNSQNAGIHIVEFEAYGVLSVSSASATIQNVAQESINASSNAINLDAQSSSINESIIPENYLLSVYPNPLKQGEEITLLYDIPADSKAKVSIYNLTGKKVLSKDFELVFGRKEVKIKLIEPLLGTYIIKSEINGKQEIKKFNID